MSLLHQSHCSSLVFSYEKKWRKQKRILFQSFKSMCDLFFFFDQQPKAYVYFIIFLYYIREKRRYQKFQETKETINHMFPAPIQNKDHIIFSEVIFSRKCRIGKTLSLLEVQNFPYYSEDKVLASISICSTCIQQEKQSDNSLMTIICIQ